MDTDRRACPECGERVSGEDGRCPHCGARPGGSEGQDRPESWLGSCGTFVLVVIGLTLLLGGGSCAVAVSMMAESTPETTGDPGNTDLVAAAAFVAFVGLALIVAAFWKPRK